MVGVSKRGAFSDAGTDLFVLLLSVIKILRHASCSVCPDAGVTVLSEVDERLMMMFGCDASPFAAKCSVPPSAD